DYCCVLWVTLILSTRSYSPPKWIVQPKNVRLGFRARFSAENNRVSVELGWQYSVSDEIPSVMPLIKCLNNQFLHQDSAGPLPARLIAIEGMDQAGKKTQTGLLANQLGRQGFRTKTLSFPDYN